MNLDKDLRKLSITSRDLPEDWELVRDPDSSNELVLIALPKWLLDKMKNGSYITPADMSQYVSEIGDLEIENHFKNNG